MVMDFSCGFQANFSYGTFTRILRVLPASFFSSAISASFCDISAYLIANSLKIKKLRHMAGVI